MFEQFFQALGSVLDFFYTLIPNYGLSIMLLTVLVIAALVAVGLLGQMGGFGRETPRHEPGRPEPETPRRPRPDAAPRPDGARPLPPPSTGDPAVDIAVPAEFAPDHL